MTTITTRVNKDSELSYGEGDDNIDLDIKTKGADYTALADDNRSVIEYTGTWTLTLPVAAVIVAPTTTEPWNDYQVTVKNAGSGVITVARSGTDTIDGSATSVLIDPDEAYTYKVNAGKTGYLSVGKVSANAISSSAVLTDLLLIKGDGGVRGAQSTGITVDASDNVSGMGTLGCGAITSTGAIQGTTITDGTATLTGGAVTGLTTPLTVAQGGTGVASATDGGVVVGSGAGALSVTAKGAAGEILVGTSGDPAFQAPKYMLGMISNDTFNDSTTRYHFPLGVSVGASNSTFNSFIAPFDGTLKNLYAFFGLNGISAATTITVQINGSGTLLLVSIPGLSTATVTNTSDEVAVSAGDKINIEFAAGAGGTSATRMSVSFMYF